MEKNSNSVFQITLMCSSTCSLFPPARFGIFGKVLFNSASADIEGYGNQVMFSELKVNRLLGCDIISSNTFIHNFRKETYFCNCREMKKEGRRSILNILEAVNNYFYLQE